MGEESNQGITRRDLLRRGAVLGGAVVWTSPVVQTLGMGRAFAQGPSTIDVSYIAFWWNCGNGWFFAKNEHDGTQGGVWDSSVNQMDHSLNVPGCSVPSGVASPIGVNNPPGITVSWTGGTVTVTVNVGCDVPFAAKGGQQPCQTGTLTDGSTTSISIPV